MKKLILSLAIMASSIVASAQSSNLNFHMGYGFSLGMIKPNIQQKHPVSPMFIPSVSLEIGGMNQQRGFSLRGFLFLDATARFPHQYDVYDRPYYGHYRAKTYVVNEITSKMFIFDYHELINRDEDIYLTLSVGNLFNQITEHRYGYYSSRYINWTYYVKESITKRTENKPIFGVGFYKDVYFMPSRSLIGADIQFGAITQVGIKWTNFIK